MKVTNSILILAGLATGSLAAPATMSVTQSVNEPMPSLWHEHAQFHRLHGKHGHPGNWSAHHNHHASRPWRGHDEAPVNPELPPDNVELNHGDPSMSEQENNHEQSPGQQHDAGWSDEVHDDHADRRSSRRRMREEKLASTISIQRHHHKHAAGHRGHLQGMEKQTFWGPPGGKEDNE